MKTTTIIYSFATLLFVTSFTSCGMSTNEREAIKEEIRAQMEQEEKEKALQLELEAAKQEAELAKQEAEKEKKRAAEAQKQARHSEAKAKHEASTPKVTRYVYGNGYDGFVALRTRPNVNSYEIDRVYNGNCGVYLGSSGNWYKINYNGQVGYVHKNYSYIQ